MRCSYEKGRKRPDTWPQTQEKGELGIHLCREPIVHPGVGALNKEVALGEREQDPEESPHGKMG